VADHAVDGALMMLSVIDRSNVSYAKLQMVLGLGMSETAYGLASSLFFIGSLVFEVPSALAAHRFGARLWFARILLTWGLLTVLLGFTFQRLDFRRRPLSDWRSGSRRLSRHHLLSDAVVSEALSRAGHRADDDRQPAWQHVRLAVRRAAAQSRRRARSRGLAVGVHRHRLPAVLLFVLIMKYLPNGPHGTPDSSATVRKSWLAANWRAGKSRRRCIPIRFGFCSTGGSGRFRWCIR
jgi:hypothetical protein